MLFASSKGVLSNSLMVHMGSGNKVVACVADDVDAGDVFVGDATVAKVVVAVASVADDRIIVLFLVSFSFFIDSLSGKILNFFGFLSMFCCCCWRERARCVGTDTRHEPKSPSQLQFKLFQQVHHTCCFSAIFSNPILLFLTSLP